MCSVYVRVCVVREGRGVKVNEMLTRKAIGLSR